MAPGASCWPFWSQGGKVVLTPPASGEHRGAWHDPGRQGNEVQVQVGWRPLSRVFQVCMGSQP